MSWRRSFGADAKSSSGLASGSGASGSDALSSIGAPALARSFFSAAAARFASLSARICFAVARASLRARFAVAAMPGCSSCSTRLPCQR